MMMFHTSLISSTYKPGQEVRGSGESENRSKLCNIKSAQANGWYHDLIWRRSSYTTHGIGRYHIGSSQEGFKSLDVQNFVRVKLQQIDRTIATECDIIAGNRQLSPTHTNHKYGHISLYTIIQCQRDIVWVNMKIPQY